MGIFALDKRFGTLFVLRINFAVFVAIIHRAKDIGLAFQSGSFVLYGTARIFCFYPVVCCFEIRAVTSLISQRPEDNAGVIESTLNVAFVAFQMCFFIGCNFCQCLFFVSHAVRFQISLSYDINTVLIAQVVPEIVVRVMAGTYGIDVELFHDLNILNHTLAGYIRSAVGIHLMTVGTFYQNRLTIDQNLCIFQFYLTETDFYRNDFANLASVFQSGTQGI